MVKFGPAGTPDSFAKSGYKKSVEMPAFLEALGLNAFEYQCGRGVRITAEMAGTLGQNAKAHGVCLSLHAPYFISLSGVKEETRLKSIDYILQSARAASQMGAKRIVVHSGSCGKMAREEALSLAVDTLQKAQKVLDENGLGHIHICPEVMGKINQLGDLEEVLRLCLVDERFIPCIDFGHLNARTQGSLKTAEDFARVIARMGEVLGKERMRAFHAHFSKIAYTTGGEKAHLTFEDTQFGPEFAPLAQVLAEYGCEPTIICESAGTQDTDALAMQAMYKNCLQTQNAKA